MPIPALIQRFAQDELSRAPELIDDVIAQALHALTTPSADLPPGVRRAAAHVAQAVAAQRPRMVAAYSESLRTQVQAIVAGDHPVPRPAPQPASAPSPPQSLALLDDETVATEIETTRTAEAIRNVAEHELRELATFLSTLAGDDQVQCDHNPVRPQAHARALLSAAQAIDVDDELRATFMRQASDPLAKALRKAYAAACTRLEDAGVTPAAYRTIILHGGVKIDPMQHVRPTARSLHDVSATLASLEERLQPLQALVSRGLVGSEPPAGNRSDSTPVHASAQASVHAVQRPPVPLAPAPDPARTAAHPERHDTLGDLFRTLTSLDALAEDFKPAVSGLLTPVRRLASRDLAVLEAPDHVVWRLIDRIAWQGVTLPDPPDRERHRTVQVISGLTEQLAKSDIPDAALFEWALERVVRLETNRIERRVARLASQTLSLAAAEAHDLAGEAPGSAPDRALDVGELPTVRADLYEGPTARVAAPRPADHWIENVRPGDVARLSLLGGWVHAQLLWRSPGGTFWLWGDCASDQTWPIRRDDLRLLHEEGCAIPVALRNLIAEVGA